MSDLPNGRHGNYAQRQAHEEMDTDDRPLVEVAHHLGVEDEYILSIDHLQFGGPLTGEELRALHECLAERFEEDDDD